MAKRKTIDISGMGGGYEATCQLILSIGLEWIKDKPLEIWKGTGPTRARDRKTGTEIRFYGLMQTGKPIRKLERIWSREIKDYTGAMHQAVLSHLHYIHRHGYEKWLEEVGGEDPKRIYEIDTEQAKRELDQHMAWARANPEEAARQAFEKGKRIARQAKSTGAVRNGENQADETP